MRKLVAFLRRREAAESACRVVHFQKVSVVWVGRSRTLFMWFGRRILVPMAVSAERGAWIRSSDIMLFVVAKEAGVRSGSLDIMVQVAILKKGRGLGVL